MPNRSTLQWIKNGAEPASPKERSLLLVSAAGEPPDALLMGQSEIVIGYWTGDYFRPLIRDHEKGTQLKVTYWASLRSLPDGVILQRRPVFGEDVRE